MNATHTEPRSDTYALGRTPEEYDRLRAQSRLWEEPTARLLDRIGLTRGGRCLDAGCGPGETMRLMADRVGPSGTVHGIDVDVRLGATAEAMLHRDGHTQCRISSHDVTADGPLPGAPYDLVYARLLLFHLPQRVAVLRRLWDAVAPGGHLLVQDYDLCTLSAAPPVAGAGEMSRVLLASFGHAGCDVRVGTRLPYLMKQAGIGAPDGTDVSGHNFGVPAGVAYLESTFRSLLLVAYAHGITTSEQVEAAVAELHRDTPAHADETMLGPLLSAAWKRKPAQTDAPARR